MRPIPVRRAVLLTMSTILLSAALHSGCGGQGGTTGEMPASLAPAGGAAQAQSPDDQAQGIAATLYFAEPSGALVAEARDIPDEGSPEARGRKVVEELLAGPKGERLDPVIPAGVELRALHLAADGTAYVDLTRAFRAGLAGGSEDALTAIWAITNSLAETVPEVQRVKILVEGEEVLDLGGHLDLSRPLAPGEGAARER